LVIAAEFLFPKLSRPRKIAGLRSSGSIITGFLAHALGKSVGRFPAFFILPSQLLANGRLTPRIKNSCIYSPWVGSGLQPDFLIPTPGKKPVFTRNLMQLIHFLFIILSVGFYFHMHFKSQQKRIYPFLLTFKNPEKYCGSFSGFLTGDFLGGQEITKSSPKHYSLYKTVS
jgi:hypothetical protein